MVSSPFVERVPNVPVVFGDYFASLEEQPSTGTSDGFFHQCFGCGPAHPDGLHVRCFKTPDGVVSPLVIAATYAGPPGAAHGGIVAACLDEVLAGAVLRTTGRVAVTGELAVRYVNPVPVEVPLIGRGRLVADSGRYVDVEGSLEEFETGRVVATGRGRFYPIPRA
jgi:acyl-coenzyme A thioesterase PaaI-like protein